MPQVRSRGIVAALLAVSVCRPRPQANNSRVSYGRQIAPIFAMHCNGCHGESAPSSGFQVSTYKGLRAGGILGADIVPGFPDSSTLVKFIEGFRGPDQRMPQGSRPLTPQQINSIRRWIAEGALNDHAKTACYKMRVPACAIALNRPLRISCRVSQAADLVLTVEDSTGRTLYHDEASIKQPPERMDRGAPGQSIQWILNPQKTWGQKVAVQLVIRYGPETLLGVLEVQDANNLSFTTHSLIALQAPPD